MYYVQQQQRHDASHLTVLPNLAVFLPKLDGNNAAIFTYFNAPNKL